MTFIEEASRFGINKDSPLPEWVVSQPNLTIIDEKHLRDREKFSKFTGTFQVARKPGFYIFKIILPLILIVMCSWSVFWMRGDDLADRMSVSMTGLLAIVAYQFVIVADLPKVSSITHMDAILLLSFLFTVMVIFENIIVNILTSDDDKKRVKVGERIDARAKIWFPATYVFTLILFAVIYQL